MKTNVLKKIALLAFLLVTSVTILKAQVTVSIIYAGDSVPVYCSVPANAWLSMYVNTTGLTSADSLKLVINFGDGASDSVKIRNLNGGYFEYYFSHTYNSPGSFPVRFMAVAPNGVSDTILDPNGIYISNACGSLSGKVYLDANSNCQYDNGETLFTNTKVIASSGGNPVYALYTDGQGEFSSNFVVPGFSYTVAPSSLYNGSLNLACPPSGSYTINSFPANNVNFGLTCNPGYDLSGSMFGWGFRPGDPCHINVHGYNYRCTPTSGRMRLVISPLLTFTSSNPAPDNISGDTITWNFLNMNVSNSFLSTAYFTTSNTATYSDSICVTLIMDYVIGDGFPGNNIIYECFPVKSSWDPNMKLAEPLKSNIAPNTPLTYMIHFQNTGNDTARLVIIKDSLDSDLDFASIQLLQSSHPMQFYLTSGKEMRFTFEHINLPDSGTNFEASQGFVKYRVNQKSNLTGGTVIANKARIYFDFNPGVATNTVVRTIVSTVGEEEITANTQDLKIYPNPANERLVIEVTQAEAGTLVSIINIQGQMLMNMPLTKNKNEIDVSGLASGMYFVKLENKDNTSVRRFIKE